MLLEGSIKGLTFILFPDFIFKMADLLREQSSLNVGLSNIRDELSIRKKASRRARIYSHIESAKKELKDEREQCMREFREEVRFYSCLCKSFLEITRVKHAGKSNWQLCSSVTL